jgi:hypothetical protein
MKLKKITGLEPIVYHNQGNDICNRCIIRTYIYMGPHANADKKEVVLLLVAFNEGTCNARGNEEEIADIELSTSDIGN